MDPNKELGIGGGFSQHLASLYLTIDFLPDKSLRMIVKKAKAWQVHNPNHEMYGFEIVEGGTQFRNIRKVRKCPKCYGKSSYGGSKCEVCASKGFVNSERSEV